MTLDVLNAIDRARLAELPEGAVGVQAASAGMLERWHRAGVVTEPHTMAADDGVALPMTVAQITPFGQGVIAACRRWPP